MSKEDLDPVTEMTLLKQRADQLGINYSNNISVEKLKKRISDHLEGPETKDPEEGTDAEEPVKTLAEERKILQDNYMMLVRLRIINMNPAKKDMPGEIITVANDVLGAFRKYIPYTGTENGYHVPKWVHMELSSRKFQRIRVVKDPRTGKERVEATMVPEFSIEVLEPLTPKELAKLAAEQRLASNE